MRLIWIRFAVILLWSVRTRGGGLSRADHDDDDDDESSSSSFDYGDGDDWSFLSTSSRAAVERVPLQFER